MKPDRRTASRTTLRNLIPVDKPDRTQAEALALAALLCAFLALGLYYTFSNPLYSKPDEAYHYAYVLHLKAGRGLPAIDTTTARADFTAVDLEGHQPPLYYATVAGLTSLLNVRDLRPPSRNPHLPWVATYVSDVRNAGVFFAGRLVSLLCGALALGFGYALVRLFLPWPVALLSVGLMGLNPQFIFIATSLSNDMASTATVHLGLWQLGIALKRRVTYRWAIGFGVIVALATLTKLTGLGLLLPLGIIALWKAWRARRIEPLVAAGVAGAVTGLLCSWWFWRNWRLYGNPFATNMLVTLLGERTLPYTRQEWKGLLKFVWESYWLDFSPGALASAEPLVYGIIGIVAVTAVAGLVVALVQERSIRPLFLLTWGWFALVFASFLTLTTRIPIVMGGGRLLFPAAIAVGATLAVGLSKLGIGRRLAPTLLLLLLSLYAMVAPTRYLRRLYPRPRLLESLPGSPICELDATFGEDPLFKLMGYDLELAQGGDDGARVSVTYYWRTRAGSERDFSVFLHLVREQDGEPEVLAQFDTYPGLGTFPTSQWAGDRIFVDRLELPLPSDVGEAVVWTGLYHLPTAQRLPVFDGAGKRIPYDAIPLAQLRVATGGEVETVMQGRTLCPAGVQP